MTGFRWQLLEKKPSPAWKLQEGHFENSLLGPATSGGLGQEAFVWQCCSERYTEEVLTRKVGYEEKGKNLKKSQDLALQFVEKFLAVAVGFFLLRRCIQWNSFWKCLCKACDFALTSLREHCIPVPALHWTHFWEGTAAYNIIVGPQFLHLKLYHVLYKAVNMTAQHT